MAGISDTTPEAEAFLRQLLRSMPFERKWRQMSILYHTGRQLHAAGMLARRPDASPEDVQADWRRQLGISESLPFRGDQHVYGSEEANLIVAHVVRALAQCGIAHALAGSWASSFFGKMRFTQDADLCVEPFPGKEQALIDALGEDYYVSLDAVKQANRQHRSFNVINTLTSFKVDLFVAKPRPFDQSLLARRQLRRLGAPHEIDVHLVTAEDVILLKLEWYRLGDESSEQQWKDVLGVLETQGDHLDQAHLDRWAAALAVADLLERARKEITP
jgi:hypothetical protein